MPDSPKKKRPQDAQRVSLKEKWEVDYWSRALKVSPSRLKTLVEENGPSVSKIRKALAAYVVARMELRQRFEG